MLHDVAPAHWSRKCKERKKEMYREYHVTIAREMARHYSKGNVYVCRGGVWLYVIYLDIPRPYKSRNDQMAGSGMSLIRINMMYKLYIITR